MEPDPAKVATLSHAGSIVACYYLHLKSLKIGQLPNLCVRYMRSSLGLANDFRKFMRGCDAITAPLPDLLKGINKQNKKGKLLHLGKLPVAEAETLVLVLKQQFPSHLIETTKCQQTLTDLKTALTTASVLTMPDFEKQFEVVTDACEVPLGGVLLQEGHPMAFCSRKLSGAELSYSATDKEVLGVIGVLDGGATWKVVKL
jgi:hypothetical protein